MAVEVTLALPEDLVESAKRFGQTTQQNAEVVLADALGWLSPLIEDSPEAIFYPPVATLTDQEVLELANARLGAAQNQRLGDLLAKGKAGGLSIAERYELAALMMTCQIGRLRKSEALAEAVQRGLRAPLTS